MPRWGILKPVIRSWPPPGQINAGYMIMPRDGSWFRIISGIHDGDVLHFCPYRQSPAGDVLHFSPEGICNIAGGFNHRYGFNTPRTTPSRRDGTGGLNRMVVVFYCVVHSGLRVLWACTYPVVKTTGYTLMPFQGFFARTGHPRRGCFAFFPGGDM